ncbi:MAG: hypothetical protein R3B13_40190 [Polyangiaceae bacterium]
MAPSPDTAELPLGVAQERDPELEALPAPRRPGRRLTLVSLVVTGLASLAMAGALRAEATYALSSGPPAALGNLAELNPGREMSNKWVQGEALLGSSRAVRYGRPLESDSYRLAPVAGNERVWVQIRVPAGMEGPRFVPPTSFVGRLIPFHEAGLRHSSLADAVENAGASRPGTDAWLLVDGEAPRTTRWALGLVGLFLGFAAFSMYGLLRLLRRPDAEA